MLQDWRYSLCENSRYKDDLTKIVDMVNLLKRKHWRLPKPSNDNTAIMLGPQNTVKSQSELESEDLEAMQAKLQELLRRATPHDLREANKLMKIITGYERTSNKYDYDKQFSDELDGLETKVELLKDMISVLESGDRLDETGMEIMSVCISNVNKIRQLTADYKEALDNLEVDDSQQDSEEYYIYNRLFNLHSALVEVIQANNDLENGILPVFSTVDESDQFLIQLGDDNEHSATHHDAESTATPTASVVPEKKSVTSDLLGLDFSNTAAAPTINKPIIQPTNTVPTNGATWNQPGNYQNFRGMSNTPLASSAFPPQNFLIPSSTSSSTQTSKKEPVKDLFDFSDMMNSSILAGKSNTKPANNDSQPGNSNLGNFETTSSNGGKISNNSNVGSISQLSNQTKGDTSSPSNQDPKPQESDSLIDL
ncbi:putative ADP-ribosylation factor-binding protein [Smittium mucronatum]|uniref:Putative ADP-ribosylation factor-binding protein n=1 Tax=Smittium mucronatum TaxID=133383 RepID=A0A1R0GN64_9FUNG|nr:putative ADP-ribosylation factor-binding protein [Smittium mucronatum]